MGTEEDHGLWMTPGTRAVHPMEPMIGDWVETERPGIFRKSEVQSLKHPLTGLFHTLVHMWSVPIRKCPICGSMFRLLFPDPRNTFPGTLIGKTGWSLIYVHAGWLLDIVCFLKTSGHRWVPHTLGSKLTSCGNTLKQVWSEADLLSTNPWFLWDKVKGHVKRKKLFQNLLSSMKITFVVACLPLFHTWIFFSGCLIWDLSSSNSNLQVKFNPLPAFTNKMEESILIWLQSCLYGKLNSTMAELSSWDSWIQKF